MSSTSLRARVAITVAIGLGLAATSCSRPKRYESAVQIVRKEVVEKGADGTADQIDFELEWDSCPGDQFQVIRGGRAFAECTAKYNVGDEVPVYVRHWWDDRGYYRWDIERLGDCWHAIEPNAVGSYEKGQECRPTKNYGFVNGFRCNRKPFRALVQRCPWMQRE
jgi:hypothetical protein